MVREQSFTSARLQMFYSLLNASDSANQLNYQSNWLMLCFLPNAALGNTQFPT